MSQRFTGGGIGSDLPEAFPPAHDDAWAEILEDNTGQHNCDVLDSGDDRAVSLSAQMPNSGTTKSSKSSSRSDQSRSSGSKSQTPIVPPGIRPRAPTRSQPVIDRGISRGSNDRNGDGPAKASGPVMPSLIKPVFADQESADVALKVPLAWEKSGPRRTPSGPYLNVDSAKNAIPSFGVPGTSREEMRVDSVDRPSKPIYSEIETAFENELYDYALPLNVRMSRLANRIWGQVRQTYQGIKQRFMVGNSSSSAPEHDQFVPIAHSALRLRPKQWIWIGTGGVILVALIAAIQGGMSSEDSASAIEGALEPTRASSVAANPKLEVGLRADVPPATGTEVVKSSEELAKPSRSSTSKDREAPLGSAQAGHVESAAKPEEKSKNLHTNTASDLAMDESKSVKNDPETVANSHKTSNGDGGNSNPTVQLTTTANEATKIENSRFIPPGTPDAHREALLSISHDPDDRKPVGAIGLTGIHVDKLSFGREYVDNRCTGDTRTFSVTRRDRVNVCIRMIHDTITETADIKWALDGVVRRRSTVHLSRHRHAVGGYAVLKLALETQWIGNWSVFVESSDGTILANVDFEVIE